MGEGQGHLQTSWMGHCRTVREDGGRKGTQKRGSVAKGSKKTLRGPKGESAKKNANKTQAPICRARFLESRALRSEKKGWEGETKDNKTKTNLESKKKEKERIQRSLSGDTGAGRECCSRGGNSKTQQRLAVGATEKSHVPSRRPPVRHKGENKTSDRTFADI